jgi:WD40 repeat protein
MRLFLLWLAVCFCVVFAESSPKILLKLPLGHDVRYRVLFSWSGDGRSFALIQQIETGKASLRFWDILDGKTPRETAQKSIDTQVLAINLQADLAAKVVYRCDDDPPAPRWAVREISRLSTGRVLYRVESKDLCGVGPPRFSNSGKYYALKTDSGYFQIRKSLTNQRVSTLLGTLGHGGLASAFSPSDTQLAICNGTRNILLFDVSTGKKLTELYNPNIECFGDQIGFFDGGRRLYVTNLSDGLEIIDAKTGISIAGIPKAKMQIIVQASIGSNEDIWTIDAEGVLARHQINTGKQLESYKSGGGFSYINANPKYPVIAVVVNDMLQIWKMPK